MFLDSDTSGRREGGYCGHLDDSNQRARRGERAIVTSVLRPLAYVAGIGNDFCWRSSPFVPPGHRARGLLGAVAHIAFHSVSLRRRTARWKHGSGRAGNARGDLHGGCHGRHEQCAGPAHEERVSQLNGEVEAWSAVLLFCHAERSRPLDSERACVVEASLESAIFQGIGIPRLHPSAQRAGRISLRMTLGEEAGVRLLRDRV